MMSVTRALAFRTVATVRAVVPCLIVFSLFGASAHASLLAPGITTLAAGEADPGALSKVEATLTVPVVAATFSGSLTSTVLSNDSTNPFPGGLTFIYQLSNDETSPHAIHRFTVSNFTGFSTDVSYSTLSGGAVPSLMDRGPLPGDVVGFAFIGSPVGAGALAPGSTATTLVIQTDATVWTTSKAAVINGSTANVDALAPIAIPEPGTCLMAVIGGVMLSFCCWRRSAS
jgi:hypothetical protein